jgi:hypothetical protein
MAVLAPSENGFAARRTAAMKRQRIAETMCVVLIAVGLGAGLGFFVAWLTFR